ncbi:TlpA family protein disulfide reductase [Rhodobacter ferrooxidans]|uniref:Redoxin domain protein n=1 Tax=Rhodobacter ferrooxidans TaxID=371731 RepID=C8S2D6_9RHOB|nr:TlpA disulfide reductase family protein [Rhodobacter sp. SW2]EEW24807.1 Redoxin domain protein [Rhodobacter sp. SW2]
MVRFGFAVLYTALLFGANPVAADIALADALREGDMRKLVFSPEAKPLPAVGLLGLDDAPRTLAEFRGKWVVLNFWATWCPPCRAEMPGLERLQAAMGNERLQVVTVATGRNPLPAIQKFLAEVGVTHLTALRDPKSELGRAMAVMGLPVTVILDPEGREVGRMLGEADWDSDNARAVLTALTGG